MVFLGRFQRLEVSWQQGEADIKRWVARHVTIASRQLSMAMVVKVSKGMIILPGIPQGRRTDPRRRRSNSRADPHNSGTKPKLSREANRKETNNTVNIQA